MSADLPLYLLLALLLAIPLVLFFATRRPAPGGHGASVRLPPGPWALPVIGHLHHLAGALPHRALRDLARRHGPHLMALRLGELRAVVATSPAAAREVLKAHDPEFASRPLSPMMALGYQGADGIIFAPHGEGWRQLRRICALELLSARRVHSLRAVREDEARRLLRAVAAAAPAPVNLSEGLAGYVADATVRAIIGSRFRDRDEYLRLLQEGLRIMPGMTLPDLFPSSRLARLVSTVPGRLRRRGRRMREFIDSIIEEHQQSRISCGDEHQEADLLDVLLRLQKELDFQYPLTNDNIKNILMDMFGAGNESSATTLQWAMAELMRNPRVMRKAQDEVRRALAGDDRVKDDKLTSLHYLPFVIKETLRLHPPAPLLLPRKCGSLCRVLGFDVPEETMVIVNAWAIARDPAHWEEPDEFLPERFERGGRDFKGSDFEFVPFGAGRRMCPGMVFGMAHIELALASLLFHFDWELPGGMAAEELDMTEAFGVTAQRRADLIVIPFARIPVSTE
ncbi:unnamed protein product [Urochloa humidicola]